MKKINAHLEKAAKNKKKAELFLTKGSLIKSKHFERISESHYKNAEFYFKNANNIPLNLAI
jgi:hypothetical protein